VRPYAKEQEILTIPRWPKWAIPPITACEQENRPPLLADLLMNRRNFNLLRDTPQAINEPDNRES
jgi:hypothetical protein